MSSVRPKLKPETPKVVTAWDAASGFTTYRTASGDWSENIADAEVVTHDAAVEALAVAAKDQKRANDPYLMEVSAEGKIVGRETLRESIRANGPTCHPQYGRQTEGGSIVDNG